MGVVITACIELFLPDKKPAMLLGYDGAITGKNKFKFILDINLFCSFFTFVWAKLRLDSFTSNITLFYLSFCMIDLARIFSGRDDIRFGDN